MTKKLKPPCLACGSESVARLRLVKSPVLENLKYTLYECGDCRSRFFDPQEHEISIPDENAKFSLSEHYVSEDFAPNPYWKNQVETIQKLKRGQIHRILDCGCRTGDFLMHWDRTLERTGVEIVPEVADVARRRGIEVINEPLENTTIPYRYDVVTCYAILEHIVHPGDVLNAMCEAVDEDGILVIMVPSYQTLKARALEAINIRWHQLFPPFHLCYFSREFLISFLQERGLSLCACVYTAGGMFNPLARVPILGGIWAKGMDLVDRHSPTRFLPIFDHMYLYFRRSQ